EGAKRSGGEASGDFEDREGEDGEPRRHRGTDWEQDGRNETHGEQVFGRRMVSAGFVRGVCIGSDDYGDVAGYFGAGAGYEDHGRADEPGGDHGERVERWAAEGD